MLNYEGVVMGWKTKDGAYVSATGVIRLDCDKCGTGVITTRWPCNDRETEDLIRKHAQDKHGGLAPRY